jgi:hypothetical protein
MRLNKNATLLAILVIPWSLFTNGSYAQGTSPTQTETRIPDGQNEYGQWIAPTPYHAELTPPAGQNEYGQRIAPTPYHAQYIFTKPASSELTPPAGQHEYGQWIDNQIKINGMKEIGTPAADYKLSPMPDTPTNFKIFPGNRMAYLKWDKMPNALAYHLFVSMDGKNFKKYYKKPFKKTEITLGILKNNQTYYFGVSSVAHYGKLSEMAIQSVTPKENLKLEKYMLVR